MKHTRHHWLSATDHAILTRVAQFDENTPAPFDPTTLDDTALAAEYTRVRTRGQELSALTDLDAAQTSELAELATRGQAVMAEQSARTERAAALQAQRDTFANMPEPTPPPAVQTQTDPPSGPGSSAPSAAPDTVTASVPAPVVPSVAALPETTPVAPVTARRNDTFSISLTPDGAGAIGKRYGDATDVREVSRAVVKAFETYGRSGGGMSSKRSIAQFVRTRGEDFHLTGESKEADYDRMAFLVRENRLEGGSLLAAWKKNVDSGQSLTAAAGWCAPSENLYDLCSLWSMDGILDLPTATATRGGFNYTNQPTYAQLDANNSFTILTEAQVIADTPKNCAEIPCPTFTDTRLDVAVSCITASFLQAAGYPELVNTWVDGLLTNHAHKLNENIIGRIVTQAGAATVIPAQGVITGTGAVGLAADASVTSSVLYAVDLAAEDMRYQSRMPFSQTFEVVLPHWILVQMRADIGRKNGWASDNYDLADAEIVRWFTVRNIRPQFVYDWQDALSGVAAGPGGAAALTTLPTTVQFLIYPAGAVVLARQDVVTLSNVYDAANLAQNLYTRLFAEEGFATLFPCGPVRLYTAQACPSGATAAQAYTACAAPVAAA